MDGLIDPSNYKENKEVIKAKLQQKNKKDTKDVIKFLIVIMILIGGITSIILLINKENIKTILVFVGIFGIFFILVFLNLFYEDKEYKDYYQINDLKLIEAAMSGTISSINCKKDEEPNYPTVITKSGEKIITRNGLIKIIINSGDTTKTTFDLDKLELDIYM